MGVFRVADYESDISFYKFKMADPISRPTFFKIIQKLQKLVYGGFWVADHESNIRFFKFNMADPIW